MTGGRTGRTPGGRPAQDRGDGDGPVLPETTADDTDTGGGDWREDDRLAGGSADGGGDRDEWLEGERPPHWE